MTTTSAGDLVSSRHLVVSQRLRWRRRALGLTQQQVIGRLDRLGVRSTNKVLSALEHGAGIDVAKLPELALALDCSVTWLLGLTEDPARWEPDPPGAPAASVAPAPVPIPAAGPRSGPSLPAILGPLLPGS